MVARFHTKHGDRPYLANRLLALLGAMYRWGVERGSLPEGAHPTRGVKPFPEQSRERYLTDGELTRLGAALTQAIKKGIPADPKRAAYHAKRRPGARRQGRSAALVPANPFAVNAIRLLLLTGWREQEVLGLRWDALDLDGGHARLTATKTGLSQRPLGGAAVQLLRELPRIDGSPFVFPSRALDEPLTDIKHVWHAVRHAAGLDTVRLHDLRHHFASMGAQQGLSLIALGAVLGHRELATTKKYAHLGDDPTKRAADQISATIAAGMASGSDRKPEQALVTPIRRARR
jgi:integrase